MFISYFNYLFFSKGGDQLHDLIGEDQDVVDSP
jgi:hypothetical protein